MDDLGLKIVKIILVVLIIVSIGIIIFCLLDPTQSFDKTVCICVSSISAAQCLMILYFLR